MTAPTRDQIVGSRIVRIGHSDYSEPRFVIEGIGPAVFRSHYVVLDNGLVLDLFTAELTLSDVSEIRMDAETDGISPSQLIGRTVTGAWRDDVFSSILILDNSIYLKDANDGAYGNPLRAGLITTDYQESEIGEFVDYWTELPLL